MELVALSIVETTHARSPVRIRVELTGPLSGLLTDTGRGMRLEPDPGDAISHAERALTTFYPVQPADTKVQSILDRHVWGPRGSLGPVVANALCESFVFESHRDGSACVQEYMYGVAQGPARPVGATDGHGTTIRFWVDSDLADEPLDAARLARRFEDLRTCIPDLDLSVFRDE